MCASSASRSRCGCTSSSTRWATPSPQVKEAIEAFDAALTLFEQKEWIKARTAFESVLRVKPDDGPAAVFLKRCNEFAVKPPAASWDGVYKMESK